MNKKQKKMAIKNRRIKYIEAKIKIDSLYENYGIRIKKAHPIYELLLKTKVI